MRSWHFDPLRPLQKPPFAQSQCQDQILILEISNIFLWLKSSPSLTLTKIEHFSKVSPYQCDSQCGIMVITQVDRLKAVRQKSI